MNAAATRTSKPAAARLASRVTTQTRPSVLTIAACSPLTGTIRASSRSDRPSSKIWMTSPTATAAKQLATMLPTSMPSHDSIVDRSVALRDEPEHHHGEDGLGDARRRR